MSDKFKAVWVSYSSISDFKKCPRAYYLKNIYKNPKTGKKIELVAPPLALGSVVHDVLEPLAKLEPHTRFESDLTKKFEAEFLKYKGIRGGFESDDEFEYYRQKGLRMINNVIANKSILENPTYNTNKDLLDPWLSEKNNIVICGKIDWINKDPATGELNVIDFKTSKDAEVDNLQLQIYALLLRILNMNSVSKLYYWFLDLNSSLTETTLPNLKQAYDSVLDLALQIKQAREVSNFECSQGGCFHCRAYEKIISEEAIQVGVGNFGREIYAIQTSTAQV